MIVPAPASPPKSQPPSEAEPEGRPAAPRSAYDQRFWLTYAGNMLLLVAISLLFRYADFIDLLGGNELNLGWIVGVGMVGSLLVRVAFGVGIDRYGPRLIWLGSTVLFALSCFAHVLLTSCHGPSIYLLRILFCSAMAGFFGASMTFICGRVSGARIAEMVGMLGTSGFLGQMLGTHLGDLLFGSASPTRGQMDQLFLLAGAVSLLSLVFAAAACRGQARPAPHAERVPVWRVLRRYNPGMVILVGMAMGMALGLPPTFLRAYTAELGIARMGAFFGIYAPAAVVARVLSRRWAERFGPEPLILVGLVGLAASLLMLVDVRAEWQLLLPGIGYGFSHALLFPSVVAAGSRHFPERHRGLGTTLMLGTWDMGNLIGAPTAGAILLYAGQFGLPPYPTMFAGTAAAMLAAAAIYAATWRRARSPIAATEPLVPAPHAAILPSMAGADGNGRASSRRRKRRSASRR